MCTIVALLGVHPRFPVVIAANRDERYARPSSGPAREERAGAVVAGLDGEHGGTWFGINAAGVAVAIADQGVAPDDTPKRSRGLLVVDALTLESVPRIEGWLATLDHTRYDPCTLLYASDGEACLSRAGVGGGSSRRLEPGLHVMVSGIGADHARAREARVLASLQPRHLARLDEDELRDSLTEL